MATAVHRGQMFVAGRWVDAIEGETQPILNPATDEVIAEVAKGTEADVDRAVQAARRAFDQEWSDTTPGERSAMLLKLAQRLEDRGAEIARIESENVGKPGGNAEYEVGMSIDNLRFFAGAARVLEGKAAGEYIRGVTSMLRREPVGVVASIAPWNYPIMMAIWKLAPALAAGNTVVLKPSEWTPLSALLLAEVAAEIFPPGVLNVITGDGEPVGAGLCRHPGVDMVSVTGDVATGKDVARAASATVKRVHLELGGKAPVVIFDDADVPAAAERIRRSGYYNSGQDCTAACRVLVGDRIYDELLSDLVTAVESIHVGDPDGPGDPEMGPVVSQTQLDRVVGFVNRAQENGANVVTGGARVGEHGCFYQPTVVAEVDQRSEIVQNEVFGPVVTVQRFASDDEALTWANDVRYGLSASVWTNNIGRAMNAAKRLRFGTVWINHHGALVSEMPHGGFKQSGYGEDLSMYSMEAYTVVKHVSLKLP
jgi:1-pyrroline dehydrogenase